MVEMALGGRYRLIEQLGAGGMAVVWRGFDEVLVRPVAIKLLSPELIADQDFIERLRAEARAAAALSHPNITSIHDYGESTVDEGLPQPFVVMELLAGDTLRSALHGGRRLPWQRAAAICAEVCRALAEAHDRGVVHRDISPNNIMLTPTGVKVMDFGISALIGEREPAAATPMLGTPAYVAPERFNGSAAAAAQDVYAVGMLLYRMLRGSLPWLVETPAELYQAHQWLPPAPLPEISGMPERLAHLCYQCLEKDPALRPTSAELARTLAWLADGTQPLPLATAGGRNNESGRMRPGLAVLGGVMTVMLGSVAWAAANHEPPPGQWTAPRPEPAGCQVTYKVLSDDGNRFDAALIVRGGEPVDRWQLEFAWPGDQTVEATGAGTWKQQGRQVVLEHTGGSAEILVSGRYAEINALPGSFRIAGADCAATVIGGQTEVTVPVVQDRPKGKGKKSDDDDEDDD